MIKSSLIFLFLVAILTSCHKWEVLYSKHCNDNIDVSLTSFPSMCKDEKTLIAMMKSNLKQIHSNKRELKEFFEQLPAGDLNIFDAHQKHLIEYTLDRGRLDLFKIIISKTNINTDYSEYFYKHSPKLDKEFIKIENYGLKLSVSEFSKGNLQNPEIFYSKNEINDFVIDSIYQKTNLYPISLILAYSEVLKDWNLKKELELFKKQNIPLFIDPSIKIKLSHYLEKENPKSLIRAFLTNNASILPNLNCSYQYFEISYRKTPLCKAKIKIKPLTLRKYDHIPRNASMLFLKRFVKGILKNGITNYDKTRIFEYLKFHFSRKNFYSSNGTFLYFYFLPIEKQLKSTGFKVTSLYTFGKRKIKRAFKSKNNWGQGHRFYSEAIW